ncbi:armadillo repeat-containing protein 8-like [Styela clava]
MSMEVDQHDMSEVFPVAVQGVLSEITTMYQPYVGKIFDTDESIVFEGIKEIKNLVIGNKKQKTNFIVLGVVPRLVFLIEDSNTSMELKIQSAIVLGSLAKGVDANLKHLLDHRVLETLCSHLTTNDLQLYEATVRCLRTIITSTERTTELLYINPSEIIPKLLENINRSSCTQECTCEIIAHSCIAQNHKDLLIKLDIINLLGDLLVSPIRRVKVKALDTLAALCYKNKEACKQCAMSKIKDKPLMEIVIRLLNESQPADIQMRAAKCLTFMFRMRVLTADSWDHVIVRKVLTRLVRMCDMESDPDQRICSAETLAYLIEVDPPLQRLAYICEQFPHKLEAYFKYPSVSLTKNEHNIKFFKHALKHGKQLHRAGFLAYASLLSNDEDIRKQVATELLVKHISESLIDPCALVRSAALKCLLSLSRSVHLLRTTFQDVGIWKSLLKLMQDFAQDINETKIISSVLCNLMLDISPCKMDLKAAGLIKTITEWLNVEDLRLNAIWIFMNMSFHAELALKLEILEAISFEQILQLLQDSDRDVIIRTLGLLRNILSSDQDKIMPLYGVNIIQACKHVLTAFSDAGTGHPGLHSEYECIRAHIVCILAGVAGGDGGSTVKTFLENETELLQQVVSYLMHFDLNLQMASVSFIYNFVRMNTGCVERQAVMIELGAVNSLQHLQTTNDTVLYDKVDKVLQQFQNTK